MEGSWISHEPKAIVFASLAISAPTATVASNIRKENPYYFDGTEVAAGNAEQSAPGGNILPVELQLGRLPLSHHGIVFGNSVECDFRLPRKNTSARHFAITFDESRRLVVHDLGSTNGLKVLYDEQDQEPRSDFKWIVGGDEFLENFRSIKIRIHKNFEISIRSHQLDTKNPVVTTQIDNFRRGCPFHPLNRPKILASLAKNRAAHGRQVTHQETAIS